MTGDRPAHGSVRLVLPGAPRTKKTSNRAWRTGARCRACGLGTGSLHVAPSEAWENWRDDLKARQRQQNQYPAPITWEVNCHALFYRDRQIGDSQGFYQGLADVLQELGVVDDDKRLVAWDFSRLLKDADRPRVEVVLSWPVMAWDHDTDAAYQSSLSLL